MIGISIIVTTHNYPCGLRALLASLEQLDPPPVPYEIIVADNGSTDETSVVLAEWCTCSPQDRIVVEIAEPGKCRAVNRALAIARGELLVFFDQDVVVDRRHLVEAYRFFTNHDCWAAQGAIGWPAETDAATRVLLECFGGVPYFEGREGQRMTELIGANMVIRREALNRVGMFDERLGPGVTGYCEDGEMAKRIVTYGGWIGVMSEAQVIHEVDPIRLNVGFHRERCRKAGGSSYRQKPRNLYGWIIPKLLVAGARRSLCRCFCGDRRNIRMAGRWYHYQGMLDMALKETGRAAQHYWLEWLAKQD